MAIAFHCSACAELLQVADTSAGQKYRCPKCSILNEVPAPTEEVKEAPPVRLRERLLKWIKRRPAVAALSFLAFVTAAVSVTANMVLYRQAKTAQAEAENNLYVGNVALANRELQDNHHDYAVELLDRCPERFRHWEWHYLRRMAPTRKLLGLQGGVVDNLAFSPDGTRLAAVAQHIEPKGEFPFFHLVSAWEVETGKRVGPALQPKEYVEGMCFHPDGKRLVFAIYTRSRPGMDTYHTVVTVRDVETGRELAGGEYTAPLEDKLAREATDTAVNSGEKRRPSLGLGSAYLTLTKATAPDVDLGTGGETVLKGVKHRLAVHRLYWNGSSHGSTRAVASGTILFDPATGIRLLEVSESSNEATLRMLFAGSAIADAVFSAQRRYLATIHRPAVVKLWDGKTGQQLFILRGHSSDAFDLAFSPDGERLFTAGGDQFSGQVKVWNTTTGQEVLSLPRHPSAVTCLALSPDGHRLATGCADGLVRIWDATPLQDGK
jgi:phage FluMu protein Com